MSKRTRGDAASIVDVIVDVNVDELSWDEDEDEDEEVVALVD